jgi:hypothetical protein
MHETVDHTLLLFGIHWRLAANKELDNFCLPRVNFLKQYYKYCCWPYFLLFFVGIWLKITMKRMSIFLKF